MEAATAAHVVKHVFLHPLRDWSLTFTMANVRFSQSRNVAFCGGTLLNRSQTLSSLGPLFGMCVVSCASTRLLLTACISHSHNITDSL
jgi:hypothetical protein